VTCPSIGNFTWSKKKYTFGGRKGANVFSEPKKGIWGPKSVWACDVSIDREFYMKKYTFGGQKGKNRPSEPKNGIWGSKSVGTCRHFLKKFLSDSDGV
jgi:hypothetical protein